MSQRVVDMWGVQRVVCAVCVGERAGDGCDDISSHPEYCIGVGTVGIVGAE